MMTVDELAILITGGARGIDGNTARARCMARARGPGFGALRVVELFARRATAPRAPGRVPDPPGPENDAGVGRAARGGARILCGWGARGGLPGRDGAARRLRGHLGLTAGGQLRHPPCLAGDVVPRLRV